MNTAEIEEKIITCLQENIELSDEPVPELTRNTAPLRDISGFDSLRSLEVLVELSEIFGCELTANKLFPTKDASSVEICMLAQTIGKLIEDKK